MALPDFTLRQLLEAGVHFGHQTHRWNPHMGPYIYGARNGIHILDLTQTVPLLEQALIAIHQTVSKNGRVLFVGTKRQASDAIAEAAERCAQYYINQRWLGGTLTNWKVVCNSIDRLKMIDEKLAGETEGFTKKERLGMERDQRKLQASLGGIREMGRLPDILFVIDTNKDALSIAEANKLGIPVIAVIDSNSSPTGIDYPIPGNDDATRAITFYCDLMARAALDGVSEHMQSVGIDMGASEAAPVEELPEVEEIVEEVDDKKTGPVVEKKGTKKLDAATKAQAVQAGKQAVAKPADKSAKKPTTKPAKTSKPDADVKPAKAKPVKAEPAKAKPAKAAPAKDAPAKAKAPAKDAKAKATPAKAKKEDAPKKAAPKKAAPKKADTAEKKATAPKKAAPKKPATKPATKPTKGD